MSLDVAERKLPGDWHDGIIPPNVTLGEAAQVETSYSFLFYRSELIEGLRLGEAATVYLGCMFDIGRRGRVRIGNCSLLNGAWFICDQSIEIGDYALVSWNVVFMDTYRAAFDPHERRSQLQQVPLAEPRRLTADAPARPIRVGRNVWIGFDCCVLPGVTIGDGAIIGARSVVMRDVPPYTLAAGNPARVIRRLENDEPPAA